MAKMRSPNYPAMGLGEAVQRTKGLWAKEKRTAVSADVAVMAIGYGGLSGPSRTALAAIKKYGLVDSDDRTVRVSDLALQILHPANDQDQLAAIQEAALKPELFAQLYDSHSHASDDALRSYLINKMEFSESGARQVIRAFKETMAFAKLDQTDYNTSDAMASEATMQSTESTALTVRSDASMSRGSTIQKGVMQGSLTPVPSQSFSWPLGPDVFAEVRITGDELRPEYFEALKKYLELAKDLVKTSFQEGDLVEYPDAYTGEIKYGRIERMYGGDAIIRTITKEEAGPNPKKFAPKPAPAKAQ